MTGLGPVTLEGRQVRLEPLRIEHATELWEAAGANEIWTWMVLRLTSLEQTTCFIQEALQAEASGQELPFAVRDRPTGRLVGTTRYLDIQPAHKGLEIGWTWYEPTAWGTRINPECKLLLLRHAFEDWGAIRVQLKTDVKNLRSQAALKKLGAHLEGTLRNHRIRPDGSWRDSLLFSITIQEWPHVRDGLLKRL